MTTGCDLFHWTQPELRVTKSLGTTSHVTLPTCTVQKLTHVSLTLLARLFYRPRDHVSFPLFLQSRQFLSATFNT